jgi:RimJ/RimL family protein N-acetyltransferase
MTSIIKTHNITLQGGVKHRIVLKPLSDEHLPLLYKWGADPEVLYWTDGGEDIARSHDKDTVHKIYGGVSQNAFCFLIEADGVPVGECWLQKMNLKNVIAMYDSSVDVRRIDMAIGEKEYWNIGIGSEFIPLVIDFAFSVEHVDVLHCLCEDCNVRSRRMWEKNGFTLILAEDLPQPQKGKYQYHFRLTRQEYFEKTSRVERGHG